MAGGRDERASSVCQVFLAVPMRLNACLRFFLGMVRLWLEGRGLVGLVGAGLRGNTPRRWGYSARFDRVCYGRSTVIGL